MRVYPKRADTWVRPYVTRQIFSPVIAFAKNIFRLLIFKSPKSPFYKGGLLKQFLVVPPFDKGGLGGILVC
jgi:hypothetical protein